MGEIGYSGRNPGLAGSAKNPSGLTSLAVILRQPPRLKIRAGIGRFYDRKASCQPLLRRKVVEQYPPFFWRGHLLSGRNSSRVSRFEAWFRLGCRGETCRFIVLSRTISR